MPFTINTQKKVPRHRETKAQILILAEGFGCLPEAQKTFDKYENQFNKYLDPLGKEQMTKVLLFELSNIHMGLVAWLANEEGQIVINGKIAFEIVDEPDPVIHKGFSQKDK